VLGRAWRQRRRRVAPRSGNTSCTVCPGGLHSTCASAQTPLLSTFQLSQRIGDGQGVGVFGTQVSLPVGGDALQDGDRVGGPPGQLVGGGEIGRPETVEIPALCQGCSASATRRCGRGQPAPRISASCPALPARAPPASTAFGSAARSARGRQLQRCRGCPVSRTADAARTRGGGRRFRRSSRAACCHTRPAGLARRRLPDGGSHSDRHPNDFAQGRWVPDQISLQRGPARICKQIYHNPDYILCWPGEQAP